MEYFVGISILIIAVGAILLFFAVNNVTYDNEVVELSSAEVKQKLEKITYTIIDVREESEFNQGHIGTSVNIPLSRLKIDYRKIPNNETILLVCQSGKRSMNALSFLKDQGFDDLINLKSGISSWKKIGYSLEVTTS